MNFLAITWLIANIEECFSIEPSWLFSGMFYRGYPRDFCVKVEATDGKKRIWVGKMPTQECRLQRFSLFNVYSLLYGIIWIGARLSRGKFCFGCCSLMMWKSIWRVHLISHVLQSLRTAWINNFAAVIKLIEHLCLRSSLNFKGTAVEVKSRDMHIVLHQMLALWAQPLIFMLFWRGIPNAFTTLLIAF